MYQSETSKFRHLFLSYCKGNGLDIGFGGDPIVPDAITVDLENPYADCGTHPVNLKINEDTDLTNIFFYHTFDYIYSSHYLEDCKNTREILSQWYELLKPGGYLCLLLPNEKRYRQYCEKTGQPRNIHHIHEDFSLEKVSNILTFHQMKIIEEWYQLFYEPEQSDYNFAIIAQKPEL